jgi:hypothetical protein
MYLPVTANTDRLQGRAGLVALRRYRGGINAIGRPFYKGGFEQRMNRREAALILELSYVQTNTHRPFPPPIRGVVCADLGFAIAIVAGRER